MLMLSLGIVSLAAWIYLLSARGLFWRADLPPPPGSPIRCPAVAAVVPARDEAETIGRAIHSLMRQDYPGEFRVVLVDDHSADGTREAALRAAGLAGPPGRFFLIDAPPLPDGWSGKLWALQAGCRHARSLWPDTEYLLFTDADIQHPPFNLRELVARALGGDERGRAYDLVSLMARLNCRTAAEKLMIPAFVFFFAMLYPFRRVQKSGCKTAGAAGGVMLLNAAALEKAGGLEAIRGALIDDCALASLIKQRGPIWLALSEETLSLRTYGTIAPIWNMVARTAFTQLRHSLPLLAGTIAGLFAAYLAPPLLVLSGSMPAAFLGASAWFLMALAYLPTVRFYRMNPLWAISLPITALIYCGATMDSARRFLLGRGGEWKGRAQARGPSWPA